MPLEHLLRLALPSEGQQRQLLEQPLQLLKVSFREFQVQLQEVMDKHLCLHHHNRTHQIQGHLVSVGLIRLEILEPNQVNSVPSVILDSGERTTLIVDHVEVCLQEFISDPRAPG